LLLKETDCFGSVDVATGRSTLFVPRLPQEYAVWMGRIKELEEFRVSYEVDVLSCFVLFCLCDSSKRLTRFASQTSLRVHGQRRHSCFFLKEKTQIAEVLLNQPRLKVAVMFVF
jgi:hypothetical protein